MFRIIYILLFILLFTSNAFSFWVWTPETNKWVNPKYSVKETPSEQLQYALDFYKVKQYKEAQQEFEKLLKHYPRSKEAPDAQYYIGLISQDQGDLFKAVKDYQVVVDKYPFSERSGELIKKQYDIGIQMLEGAGKTKVLYVLPVSENNVIEVFRMVIKNAPYGPYAPQAQYKIGLYMLEKQMYQESRDEFEKLISDYPESEWAKASKFQIALADSKRSSRAQYDQKITQAAVAEFKEFTEQYPEADLSQKAKDQVHALTEKEAENNFVIAQFYEKQKDYSAAKIYYQSVADDFSATTWAPKALKKIQEISKKSEIK